MTPDEETTAMRSAIGRRSFIDSAVATGSEKPILRTMGRRFIFGA